MKSLEAFFTITVVSVLVVPGADGHGAMIDPPGRNAVLNPSAKLEMINYTECPTGNGQVINWSYKSNFCGGRTTQNVNKGKCSGCGDNWAESYPRNHDLDGKYAKKITPVRAYLQGQIITVTVRITAAHLGSFEFRLCNVNEAEELKNGHLDALTDCFNDPNKYMLLKTHDGQSKYTGPTGRIDTSRDYDIDLILPPDFTCPQGCSLQWRYEAGNNNDDKPFQEHFVNCADIIIASCDDYKQNKITQYCGPGLTDELRQCDGWTGNDWGTSSSGSQSTEMPGGAGGNAGTSSSGGHSTGTPGGAGGNTGTSSSGSQSTGTSGGSGGNAGTSNGGNQSPATSDGSEQQTGGSCNNTSTGTSTNNAATNNNGWEEDSGTWDADSQDNVNDEPDEDSDKSEIDESWESDEEQEPDNDKPEASTITCNQCSGLQCDNDCCELSAKGVTPNFDDWCNSNCKHNPPYCPSSFCRTRWELNSQCTRLLHQVLRGLLLEKIGREDGGSPYRK